MAPATRVTRVRLDGLDVGDADLALRLRLQLLQGAGQLTTQQSLRSATIRGHDGSWS